VTVESILQKANKAYLEKDYSLAMEFYLKCFLSHKNISRFLIPNIWKIIKNVRQKELGLTYIVNRKIYLSGEWNSILLPSTNLIVVEQDKNLPIPTENFSPTNIKSFNFSNQNLAHEALDFVTKNPLKQLIVLGEDASSILIGLLYEIIWAADVSLLIKTKYKSKKLKYTIAETLNFPAATFIFLGLAKEIMGFIESTYSPNILAKEMRHANFKKYFLEYNDLFDGLSNADNLVFLNTLFKFNLGRAPEAHEVGHFVGQLNLGRMSRSEIGLLVCFGDESLRYLRDHHVQKKSSIYLIPELTDFVPEKIVIPFYENPIISVLIPVYGNLEYTLACLESIANYPGTIPFEVLVIDDKSPDNSVEILKKVKNIRLIENQKNLGFLRSCNYGATFAKGEYIHFLNNDTVVRPGWLDQLVKTFDIFPGTGLVGSKLLYPDGSLQEAGGIIWNDGSAWNYGHKQDPALPQLCYAREVDYISGASITVPKQLFDGMGGFDELFVPAYCEDSDLALKIRSHGHRVIYQPMSEIVHFEGVSSGTDLNQGVKAYQIVNSQKLFDRWKDLLAKHRPNASEPENEKDRRMRHRVLVLEHCTPTPDQDAGSVSVFNMLLMLREMDFQVTFIPEDNYLYMPDYTTRLQRAGVEVLYKPYINSVEDHLKESGPRYDLVFLFRPRVVEKHIKSIKKYCPQAKTLFYTHDIHHIRLEREFEVSGDRLKQHEANIIKTVEFEAIESVDSTIVVSQVELEILTPQLPKSRLRILPLLLNIPKTQNGYKNRKGFCFIGGFQHPPNIDAVLFFAKNVMPIVRKVLPGVKFHVVGSNVTKEIKDLACADIEIHGFIQDLNTFMDNMRLSVAPLRFGAGVKGKVGTSLAAGLPSVLTNVAMEGMAVKNGEHALIANDPESIAEAIKSIYNNQSLWEKISKQGIEFAEAVWGPKASFDEMFKIIHELLPKVEAKAKYPLVLYNEKFN
jgi:GT2 family glycosyltransferase